MMLVLLLAATAAAPPPQPSKSFAGTCYARAKTQPDKDFCAAGEEEARRGVRPDKETDRCFDQAMSQTAMNACADAAYKRADARLNARWAKTAAAFKRLDEDNKGTPWPTKAFDSLLEGQRAWLTYREATCRAQGLV